MSWPGLTEILVILVLILIFFGAGRLPRLGEGLGKGIRNFKDAITGKTPSDPDDEEKK